MKKVLTTIAALALTTGMASAQAIGVGQSNSQSLAQSQSAAASNNAITFNNPADLEQTIRTVPSVSAPGFSSGHPCGLAWSGGVAVLGFGVTGGNTVSDDACLLAQMGQTQAAVYMIAARNPAACRALQLAGVVTCSGSTASASVSASSRTTPVRTAAATPQRTTIGDVVTCVRRDDGAIVARGELSRFGITAQQATAYCAGAQ